MFTHIAADRLTGNAGCSKSAFADVRGGAVLKTCGSGVGPDPQEDHHAVRYADTSSVMLTDVLLGSAGKGQCRAARCETRPQAVRSAVFNSAPKRARELS
jgi:hypothetical protein